MWRTTLRTTGRLPWLAVVASLFGCGQLSNADDLPAARQNQVLLGSRCPALGAEDREAAGESFGRVFIEVVDVTDTSLHEARGMLVGPQRVETHQLSAALLKDGESGSLLWRCGAETCRDVEDGSAELDRWRLSLVPGLPKRASDPMHLTQIALARHEQGEHEQVIKAQPGLTVEAVDQQPVVVELSGPQGQRTSRVIITPYLIDSDADLRALYECKKRRRAALMHEMALVD